MIRFTSCSKCGTRFQFEGGLAARVMPCPTCRSTIDVPASEIGPGICIGGFAIEKLISVGGMGKLFLARQLSMDRLVALKILPQQFCIEKENVERFRNEVRMAARLQHPNVVSSYEAGEDEGVHYLAMQYIEGQSLDARISRDGVLSEKEVLRIGRKLAIALAYGWDQHRIIHRDVKPANVLMDKSGEPRLVDMGISKSLTKPASLTSAGTVIGTPNFMAPEQIDDAVAADTRADMFSLGATLYNALTGKIPFEGKALVQTLQHMAVGVLPNPRSVFPQLSRHCVDLLRVMMARKPAARHARWEDLIADIDRVARKMPVKAVVPKGKATVIGLSGAPGRAKARRVHFHRSDIKKIDPHGSGTHAVAALRKQVLPRKPQARASRLPLTITIAVIIALGVIGGVMYSRQKQQQYDAELAREGARVVDLKEQFALAIAQAEANPQDDDEARKKLAELQQQFVGTGFERHVEEELKRLRHARTLAKDQAWSELKGRVDRLFADGKMDESMALLRDYDWEYSDALGSSRADYITVLTGRVKRQRSRDARRKSDAVRSAQAKLDRLVDQAAESLLAGRGAQVREQVEAADAEKRFKDIPEQWLIVRKRIMAVLDVNAVILNSFRKHRGRSLSVGLKRGAEKLTIREVAEQQVVAERHSSSGASVLYRFGVSDLDSKERYRRAGADGTEEGRLRQGLVAAESKAYESAAKCFARVDGPLAKALNRRSTAKAETETQVVRATRRSHLETGAEAEYVRMLRSVNFSPGPDGPQSDASALQRMKLTKLARQRVRDRVRTFNKQYSETEFARTHAPVLDVLLNR